jgi:replicative DNA helicase
MTNICLDVLQTNSDVQAIYYSLDDSSSYTAYRMLSVMTGISINMVKRKQYNPNEHERLNNKRQELIELVATKRLIIKDLGNVSNINELEADIKLIGDHSKLVVFIDGLFNLSVNNGSESIRVENIERANIVKTLTDAYNIPIFTTAELRKKLKNEKDNKKPTMNDIMETGKFAYNANVVFLMYTDTPEELLEDQPTIKLEYAKNKLSDYRKAQELYFERAKGLMKETLISLAPSTPAKISKDDLFGGNSE